MRQSLVRLTLAAGFLLLSAQVYSQTLGTFQSTLDNRTYEVRQRGQTGLDIYADDGTIAATLDKKKPTDTVFKGQTQRLATNCPSNSGKVEVLQITFDRIRARVEIPSKGIGNQMACNMMFLNHWQSFDLIKQGTGTAQPASPAGPVSGRTGGIGGGSDPASQEPATRLERNGFRYELEGCRKEDQRIVCHLNVTNISGNDDNLTSNYGKAVFFIDQFGNRIQASVAEIGNGNLATGPLVIPNLRMPVRIVFENTNPQITTLVRLSLPMFSKAGWTDVQFSNVPVTNPDANGGGEHKQSGSPIETGRSLMRGDLRYELQTCRRESQKLICEVQITNSAMDHRINWYPNQTYVIDQLGNRLQATDIKLGNTLLHENEMIPANARLTMTITFDGLATNAVELARVEVGGNDGAPVTLRYSSVSIQNR